MISTGANLYHDLHYALNFTLRRGSPFVDDVELYEQGVIRIYDVLFPATVLLETDAYIRDFLVPLRPRRSDRHLGAPLPPRARSARAACPAARSIRWSPRAAKYGVPIYTSSPGDSSIGMNVAYHELMNDSRLMIDPNRTSTRSARSSWPASRTAASFSAADRRRTSTCRRSRRSGRSTAFPRAATTTSSRSRPTGRLGRTVGRDAGGSRELGQGESGRAARYGRRATATRRSRSRCSRVRRRLANGIAARARSSCIGATSSSPTSSARPRRRATIRGRTGT